MIDYKVFSISVTENKTSGSDTHRFDNVVDLSIASNAWLKFDAQHTNVTGMLTVSQDPNDDHKATLTYELDTPGGKTDPFTLRALMVVGQKAS